MRLGTSQMSSHLLQPSVFLIPGMPGSTWEGCLSPLCSQASVITSCVAPYQRLWKSLETARVNWIVCLGCWPIGAPSPATGFGMSVHSWNHILRCVEFVMLIEEVCDLPMHQTLHDLHHNAGKTYGSIVLWVMLASLLAHRSDNGTGPVRW